VSDTVSTRVTFFEDRAEVVRDVAVTLSPGWNTVAIVSPTVDDGSLVVRAKNGGLVREQRVTRRLVETETPEHVDARALEEVWLVCARAKVESEAARERWRVELDRIAGVRGDMLQAMAHAPDAREQREAWRAAYAALAAEEEAALSNLREMRKIDADRGDALDRARARLETARATSRRYEGSIRAFIEAPSPTAMRLEVTYRLPNALWRPEHVVAITRKGTQSRSASTEVSVAWTTLATAWQRTGESFEGVQAVFSTARPARDATLPLLSQDLLTSTKKRDEAVTIEARAESVESIGAAGTKFAQVMPGVDDGGTPLAFTAAGVVNVPSTGRPVRFELTKVDLQGVLSTIVYPEVDRVPRLRLETVLPNPMLAGPVHVTLDDVHAGRSRVRFVASGDRLELGVGTDDEVRVRRTVEESRDTTALIGTQHVTRTVTCFLSNVSTHDKVLIVRERAPVSEIAGLVVEVSGPGFRFDAKTGFLEREVVVRGNSTEVLSFVIQLRAPAKMALPF
jgi:uncharacterized protein (TIGR02231 family)